MLKIAFCDDETQETRRLEALLEEYAADRGQDFAHTSYQSPVELMPSAGRTPNRLKSLFQKLLAQSKLASQGFLYIQLL